MVATATSRGGCLERPAGRTPTTPAYDAAGNTTTVPIPPSPANSFTCTYDAWNRLVKVKTGEGETETVYALNDYDSLHRMVAKKVATVTYHYYYNEAWQALEVRADAGQGQDPDPIQQFVWDGWFDKLTVRPSSPKSTPSGVEGRYIDSPAGEAATSSAPPGEETTIPENGRLSPMALFGKSVSNEAVYRA